MPNGKHISKFRMQNNISNIPDESASWPHWREHEDDDDDDTEAAAAAAVAAFQALTHSAPDFCSKKRVKTFVTGEEL